MSAFSEPINPYLAPASRELDAYVHYQILKNALAHNYPRYSTDRLAAENLKRQIERTHGVTITTGPSTVPTKPWFARYELETGNPTEVLAENYPLAVCRLVILLAKRF